LSRDTPRNTIHRPCPQCDTDNAAVGVSRYAAPEWGLKDCPECGFVYIENAPVYEELVRDYAWETTSAQWSDTRKRRNPWFMALSKGTRWRLHLFRRNSMEALADRYAVPGIVLDLGCGGGEQLKRLAQRFIPYGVEISRGEAENARRNLTSRPEAVIINQPATQGLLGLASGSVSAVVMRSYLEHESHPKQVLDAAHHALRPGGHLFIKVPNYGALNRMLLGKRWCGFRFPDHLNYFTPDSLKRMVAASGFTITRFGITDRLPTNDNMWMVAQAATPPVTH